MERAEVVRGAVRHFQANGSLDMDLLATQLAVSRATLYRIVGSRDALLGDALWSLARRTLDRARQAREKPGADGVIEVSRRFAERLWAARPITRFVTDEPKTAARVLFTADGRVHRRAVATQREIFLEAGVDLRADAMERAFLYVRIMESVLYGELIGGRRVEFPIAEKALRALLAA